MGVHGLERRPSHPRPRGIKGLQGPKTPLIPGRLGIARRIGPSEPPERIAQSIGHGTQSGVERTLLGRILWFQRGPPPLLVFDVDTAILEARISTPICALHLAPRPYLLAALNTSSAGPSGVTPQMLLLAVDTRRRDVSLGLPGGARRDGAQRVSRFRTTSRGRRQARGILIWS